MNTKALGIMTIFSSMELEKRFIKWNKDGSKKQKISTKRSIKESEMRMDHQCLNRQQFRRKTTPYR